MSVVLVGVDREGRAGLVVIRRGIEPQIGRLALVGGFVDADERWQDAGAREVREETGLSIAADALAPMWFTSTEPQANRVLLFSTGPVVAAADMPAFAATAETTERGAVFGPDGLDEVFAFSLHVEAARRWFAARDIAGPHDYCAL